MSSVSTVILDGLWGTALDWCLTNLRLGTESTESSTRLCRDQAKASRRACLSMDKRPPSKMLSWLFLDCLDYHTASCNALGNCNTTIRDLPPVPKVRTDVTTTYAGHSLLRLWRFVNLVWQLYPSYATPKTHRAAGKVVD